MISFKKNIDRLSSYTAGKRKEDALKKYNIKQATKLSSNENPWGVPKKVLKVMSSHLKNLHTYPDSSCENLLQAIANTYKLSYEQVIATNGADEVFLLIALAFLNKNDSVLISENTFSQYNCVSQIANAKVVNIPLKQGFYNLDNFLKKKTLKTKMIFLCNPNNPTGTYFNQKSLNDFLKKIPESCLVIIDEAYAEYQTAFDFPQFQNIINKYTNVIVVRTFSKIYGLAGLRIGYAMSNKALIAQMQKVRNFNPFNVNSIAQVGATTAIQQQSFIKNLTEKNKTERGFLQTELKKLNIKYFSSQANFICFECPYHLEALEFAEKMMSQGVLIRPLKSFGLNTCCRVSIGRRKDNIVFLKAIEKIGQIF